jgi:EAL domain-containing protein (putative c-di-GMP-specific phosphodiesterase class I)
MEAADANGETPKARLRDALRGDEFELYVQPIVRLQQRDKWEMAEVLVRLRQEEQAMLPPGEFLPAFELYGMLPQLDAWVVRKALARPVPARLSINISGQTLESEGFLRLLADLPASKNRLLFEIEESDIVQRPQAAQRFCEAVHGFGGGIVIDGFGRQQLSFDLFAGLRPQFLKLDGALTRRLPGDEASLARVRTIRRLAEALKVGLIAESVEAPELFEQLAGLGVGHAQGYGVCPPKPLDELFPAERRLALA